MKFESINHSRHNLNHYIIIQHEWTWEVVSINNIFADIVQGVNGRNKKHSGLKLYLVVQPNGNQNNIGFV